LKGNVAAGDVDVDFALAMQKNKTLKGVVERGNVHQSQVLVGDLDALLAREAGMRREKYSEKQGRSSSEDPLPTIAQRSSHLFAMIICTRRSSFESAITNQTGSSFVTFS
jgi:hypothetical protein